MNVPTLFGMTEHEEEGPLLLYVRQAGGSKEGCSLRRNTLTAELLAEFLGTFTLLIFGLGVVAHFVLRNAVGDPLPAPGIFGNFTTVNFAWGFGVVMGVYVPAG